MSIYARAPDRLSSTDFFRRLSELEQGLNEVKSSYSPVVFKLKEKLEKTKDLSKQHRQQVFNFRKSLEALRQSLQVEHIKSIKSGKLFDQKSALLVDPEDLASWPKHLAWAHELELTLDNIIDIPADISQFRRMENSWTHDEQELILTGILERISDFSQKLKELQKTLESENN